MSKSNLIAIKYGNYSLKYDELSLLIIKYSKILVNNFSNKRVIIIDSTKSINSILMILSCINSEYTYCPIDFSLPIDRINNILKSLDINFIFSENYKLKELYKDYKFLGVKDFENIKTSEVKIENYHNPNEIAYIMFTSGSTGTPKGIKVSNKCLFNIINWHIETYYCRNNNNNNNMITLQYAPLYFDVSIQEILSSLISNGTLIIYNDIDRQNPFTLTNIINSEKVNNLFLPYTMIRILAEIENNIIDTVKYIFTAGEKLKITEKIRNLFFKNKIILVNQYGPTETHVVTAKNLGNYNKNWDIFPSIGNPINGVLAKILVGNVLYDIKPNLTGELVLYGDKLFSGYVDSSINNKYTINDKGKIFYKTGDIVRIDDIGEIHFIDRNDNIVKVRGFRIDIEEIEKEILLMNGVFEAFIIYNNSKECIDLYYKGIVTKEDIIVYLNNKLPRYMIPEKIMYLDSFPLTKTGKVDKNKLLSLNTLDSNKEMYSKNSELLLELISIWKKVLNSDMYFSNDDLFFQIGGNSLKLMELFVELSKKYNNLKFEDLLENLTINNLYNIIKKYE